MSKDSRWAEYNKALYQGLYEFVDVADLSVTFTDALDGDHIVWRIIGQDDHGEYQIAWESTHVNNIVAMADPVQIARRRAGGRLGERLRLAAGTFRDGGDVRAALRQDTERRVAEAREEILNHLRWKADQRVALTPFDHQEAERYGISLTALSDDPLWCTAGRAAQ